MERRKKEREKARVRKAKAKRKQKKQTAVLRERVSSGQIRYLMMMSMTFTLNWWLKRRMEKMKIKKSTSRK